MDFFKTVRAQRRQTTLSQTNPHDIIWWTALRDAAAAARVAADALQTPHRTIKNNAQVQDAMGEAARVANERIDTANRGKKMLDDGGPDVELKLRCKRQCRKTVEDDGKQARALDQLARDYDDAISKLKASLTTEALQPEEKYDFEQLVGLYEERKAACERASAALANLPPPSPFISQEEEDAIRMLAVKDKYQVAQREASNLAADASAAARAATS